jgi:VWFA-related protein
MKKLIFLIVFIALAIILLSQEIQHETIAINIEVPVRVFTKGKFVEELSIKDFEVYEDGVLQKIEALYLVKRTVIAREETEIDTKQASRIFIPETSRTFILMFEMMDYFPKIRETLDYFFEKVISSGDSLFIVTPLKTYTLKKELLDKTPREVIVDQLNGKLRKDIKSAAREYKSMLRDLEWLNYQVDDDPSGSTELLAQTILEQIKYYRHFDDKKLMEFRNQLKEIEGQKYVFLFFQKKIVPVPPKFELPPDYEQPLASFNVAKIKKAYSDSLISINFIYVTKTEQHQLDMYRMNPAEQRGEDQLRGIQIGRSGVLLIDQSAETFGAFHEMAEATGGTTDSSANIAASFQRAVISSENYYLLYYSPKNYKTDGKFKKIKIKVKGKNYRVTHRAGYIAD